MIVQQPAAEALRRSEERLREIIQSTQDGFWILDPSGRFVDVNDAYCMATGFSREELLSMCIPDLEAVESPEDTAKHVQLIMETGGDIFETRHRSKDGRILDFEVRARCLSDGSGLLFAFLRDVTDQNRAQAALRASEAKFRALFQNGSDAILLHRLPQGGPPERFLEVNDVACRMLGYTHEELLSIPPAKIVPESEIPNLMAALKLLTAEGKATFDLVHRDKQGREIPTEVNARMFLLNDERVVMSVARDTTERRRTEGALQEANEKLLSWVDELEARNLEGALVNEMGDLLQTCMTFEDAYSVVAHSMPKLFPDASGGLYVISASRNVADAMSTWGKLSKSEAFFTPNECWGLRRGRTHAVAEPDSGLICHHIHDPLRGGYLCIPMMAQGEALGILHVRSEDGDVPESMRMLAVTVADHIGLALANLRLRQTLRDQAVHDQLTGLFNRRYMEEMLERELGRAARHNTSVGIVMMDVDHFKRFNDMHGHAAGDAALSAIGNYLRTHVRDEDIACRYGGEELILILPDADADDTVGRASALLEGIRRIRIEHHRQVLGPVTVSMGIAAYPSHGKNSGEVLRSADSALYQAKSEGRDRVVVSAGARDPD